MSARDPAVPAPPPDHPAAMALPIFDGSLTGVHLAMLLVAMAVALGFEFVNGFHDTANAVATVIYTRSLAAEAGGRLVGPLQLPAGSSSAGRRSRSASSTCCRSTCWSERLGRGAGDGAGAADRGDRLEPRDLVPRPAGVELAHADRRDPGRRPGQLGAPRPGRSARGSTGTRPARSGSRS